MTLSNAFEQLGLSPKMADTLTQLGYETPTPVQEKSIPILMGGADLVAQAQTGTGKTAAFALPVLSNVDTRIKKPQAIVIAPTRELAIQVSEAFQAYAKNIPGFHVLPIYGGQDYRIQLRALKRGVQVIVGTPGRVMDHLRQGTIHTDELNCVVLDEADEMLKMGFIEDVEWILEQIPNAHQTALFSATMPTSIQKIANRYLKNPQKVTIKATKNSVSTIDQYSIHIPNRKKMDVLTRILEVEEIDASIIFVRTRNLSAEVSEKLQARGYSAAPLNGDMNQSLREKVISRIKSGSLDIIVATDVAARGIDVDRITHVFNYDIPHDVEAYIHRIGRTGRAGRQGKAILFVTPREERLLSDIERATKKPIDPIKPPTHTEINARRKDQLIEKTVDTIQKNDRYSYYLDSIQAIIEKAECSAEQAAAALAYQLQNKLNPPPSPKEQSEKNSDSFRPKSEQRFQRKKPGKGRFQSRLGSKNKRQSRQQPSKHRSQNSKSKR